MVSVGNPEKPVEVEISGNTIRNTTQKGISVRQIGGRARIERNIVTTNVVYAGPAPSFVNGILCACSGSYLITHNLIRVADPNGAGIRIKGCSVGALPRAPTSPTTMCSWRRLRAPCSALGARGSKSRVWPEALSSSGTGFGDVPESGYQWRPIMPGTRRAAHSIGTIKRTSVRRLP